MYQFSDSDSVDSDEGIRYKTESIRNKKLGDKDIDKDKESRRHRDRKRSRSRSRSRHHKEKKRVKDRKRTRSPKDNSHRKTSGTKNRESEKTESRRTRKEKEKSKNENAGHKNDSQTQERDKSTNNSSSLTTVKEDCIPFGPSLPKKESSGNLEKVLNPPQLQEELKCNPQNVEDSNTSDLFGPALPPDIKPMKIENEHENHSQNENTSGPKLPPPNLSKISIDQDTVIGPVLPPHFITVSSLDDDSASDKDTSEFGDSKKSVIGPALPPHLSSKNKDTVIGPALPPHLQHVTSSDAPKEKEEESDEDIYGPVPIGAQYTQAHIELEERALKMKMDQLEPTDNKAVREEWMLTLPEVKAASVGLGPRQFRSKAGPDLSDRSSWTDTPEDKAKKKERKAEPVVDLKREAELKYIHKRNAEQEESVKKHSKGRESLLEIHRKKLKNEKKNEGGPSERRPFSRETDLQVNRFDEAQKKAVLKKAQLLDNRFSSGESKFL